MASKAVQIEEETPQLCANDGFLFLNARWGIHSLDLIALLQSNILDISVLTQRAPQSPLGMDADSVFAVVADTGSWLTGWREQKLCCEISLPGLSGTDAVLSPVIAGRYAFLTQRGHRHAHVIDLEAKQLARTLDCGGAVVFATPVRNGIGLLVNRGETRQILWATPERVNVAVPLLPKEITWIALLPDNNGYVWGDGSRCFVQTPEGPRKLEIKGNLGFVKVQDKLGWAIAETAESSVAVAINLLEGRVAATAPLGESSFTDFAVAAGRVIASNGHEIRSVRPS